MLKTRTNEFGCMTARKDDTSQIRSIFYNFAKKHSNMAIKGHIRPYRAQGMTDRRSRDRRSERRSLFCDREVIADL